MWQNYSKAEELKKGFAIETTVGQFINALPVKSGDSEEENLADEGSQKTDPTEMYVGAEDHDIHVGAVQYQKRDTPDAVQPTGYQESVNFFKGFSVDYEVEFRPLINPFDSANLLRLGEDGVPVGPFSDVDDSFILPHEH